ncbi:M14 metallopeptidase family protein [Glaciecola petra]|uniref:M14 family metallopeptidase n=1 Tax=Glaciecola petra TaxID=3075602 RepID=A0ABU2ZU83_9ALTE|nr:M14 family metallopeptidase [Aestuariibacter sp. P117]MDT0595144.1 M14 family metallopeptidase [Aestuariibacter sp. P117]
MRKVSRFNQVFFICILYISTSFIIATGANAQSSDIEYLPSNQNYDPDIPLPADVLGYPVGTWHVRHDQLVNYMRLLAEKSDRISIETTGYTHEQRPLLLMTVTAPKNHQNIDTIQKEHIARINSGEAAKETDPLIIYMGYSVHGNEPSGANASLLIAYHLAASNSPEVLTLLNENVVLLDPSLNPDGLSRFAQWANTHKGKNVVTDPLHREHTEAWPSGRTNHYWFDLNRDWLLLTHPESKARIAKFHEWRPHVLTDFHEMGTNSTYFFQPGVPSRKNPWTPDQNVTLTNALGEFHAKALDADKQLYFTQESFDDFYYGKGSTYPDAHGSIGILFEQASSRGHAQESINGVLTFPASIKNQVTTSLSTFAGALANKSPLLSYQRDFYRDTQALIDKDKTAGYLIAQGKDPSRFIRMLNILKAHKIEFSLITKDVEVGDKNFKANEALYIPLDQNQYRLIRSLFSERQRFADNTFYDVSNWNIGLAFNLQYSEVKSSVGRKLSLTDWAEVMPAVVNLPDNAYAYAFEWFDHQAPSLLQTLLEKNVQVRVAGDAFSAKTSAGVTSFAKGTVLIPSALSQPDNLVDIISSEAAYLNIKVHSINSGLTPTGIDLGSRQMAKVDKPEVLLIGGVGTSSYEVGEIWHYLDIRLGVPATLWDARHLNTRALDRYTHIIFASGRYSMINERGVNSIEEWVKDGGVLIGQKTALNWFSENAWIDNEPLSSDAVKAAFPTKDLQYGDQRALAAKKLVAGAAYQAKIDLTHPLFFGFENDLLPLFKTNNMVLKTSDNPFQEIAKYTEKPLLAGYSADEMQDLIKETTAIVVTPLQRGHVIGFVDNVHFRGYWDGTNKLTANALYLSPLL